MKVRNPSNVSEDHVRFGPKAGMALVAIKGSFGPKAGMALVAIKGSFVRNPVAEAFLPNVRRR